MSTKMYLPISIVLFVLTTLSVYAGGQSEKAAASSGKVTLTMLDLNPEGGPAVDAVNKLFMEQYPNIEVQHTTMNSRQYDQKIQALAASGDMPDIPTVQMFPQYKGMAKDGLFVNLQNLAIVKSGKFDPLALSSMTLSDGNVYGLSWNYLAVAAYYNKAIFAKYNLSIPTDWPEFLKVCETLKSNGVTPIASPLGDGWTSQYPVYTAGINIIYAKDGYPAWDQSLVAGKAKFDSPGWIKTFEKVKELYDKGYFGPNPMGGKYESALSNFANGKAAMLILGTWIIPDLYKLNPNLELSMFPVPFNSAGSPLYALFESELGMAISKTSKHVKQAEEYMNFFYTKKPYEEYLRLKKGFSNIKGISVAFDPSVKYITDNYLVQNKTFPSMSREWPTGQDLLMFKLFQQVMLNQIAIPDALKQMDQYFQSNRK